MEGMDLIIFLLIIAGAVLAMYGVWKDRGQSAIGVAVLAIAIALLLGRLF